MSNNFKSTNQRMLKITKKQKDELTEIRCYSTNPSHLTVWEAMTPANFDWIMDYMESAVKSLDLFDVDVEGMFYCNLMNLTLEHDFFLRPYLIERYFPLWLRHKGPDFITHMENTYISLVSIIDKYPTRDDIKKAAAKFHRSIITGSEKLHSPDELETSAA